MLEQLVKIAIHGANGKTILISKLENLAVTILPRKPAVH